MCTKPTRHTSITQSSFRSLPRACLISRRRCRNSIIFRIISVELCRRLRSTRVSTLSVLWEECAPICRHPIGCCCRPSCNAAHAICRRKVEVVTFDPHTSHRVNRAESEEMTSREVYRRKGFWVLNGAANQQYFSALTTYLVKIVTQLCLTNYHTVNLGKIYGVP